MAQLKRCLAIDKVVSDNLANDNWSVAIDNVVNG